MVVGHPSHEIRVSKMHISYVESAGCLMSRLLGVLCRVCWVSYVASAGCLVYFLFLAACALSVSCEEIVFVYVIDAV